MSNIIRHLINADGEPFKTVELQIIHDNLDNLTDTERTIYRNNNAQAIASHASVKTLIVSGPGTGKSTIFKQRISYWLARNESSSILALSFVRKLVADLDGDIRNDTTLSIQQKQQAEIYTLHKYARSIVEQNHGISDLRFQAHMRIISDPWISTVWEDTLLLAGGLSVGRFSHKKFNNQLHNLNFEISAEWQLIRESYLKLSKFYNAAGFADLIIHAKKALEENPSLVNHQYFIIDEYQDFNIAEEEFIKVLTNTCSGLLIVGDDDQVLYDKLKSGKASLIRGIYQDTNFTKAMLPFCSRSSFHITKTAEYFIKQSPEVDGIEKIYLPISLDAQCPKIEVVACATASSAVDYIRKFTEEYVQELNTRKADLETGQSKDPFLLILTPDKNIKFYTSRGVNKPNKQLLDIISQYRVVINQFSEDYFKVLTYYSLSNHPENNFTFRKVLYYEDVQPVDIITLIQRCFDSNQNLCTLTDQTIQSILSKCQTIQGIINSDDSIDNKVQQLTTYLNITDQNRLKADLEKQAINTNQMSHLENQDDETAELEELDVKQMSAIELLSLSGAKGLSADHVIIIGFDNQNMTWITRNAFYVALTRARKSIRLITAIGCGGSQTTHDFLNKMPDAHIEFCKYTKKDRHKTPFANRRAFIMYFSSLNYNRSRRTNS